MIITWLRTAAVSALATDYLAAPEAKSIALIGAGQQASSHLAALQSVIISASSTASWTEEQPIKVHSG
jgi:ornithine cyclodeaminase/alanine dehydrogenase-like protein (mu-crystallin family)